MAAAGPGRLELITEMTDGSEVIDVVRDLVRERAAGPQGPGAGA